MTEQHYPLYDSAELESVLARMAAKTVTLFSRESMPALIGILRRGEPLAQRLRTHMLPHWPEAPLPVYALQLKRYGDDLSLLHPETALAENPALAACDLSNTPLLLVDDVLYQGHSLLRACTYLVGLGARKIHTAVLVDRGIASLPIKADIAGIQLMVPAADVIECRVPPYEPEFRVDIWHRRQ